MIPNGFLHFYQKPNILLNDLCLDLEGVERITHLMRDCRIHESHLLSFHRQGVNENLFGNINQLYHHLLLVFVLFVIEPNRFISQSHDFNLEKAKHRLFRIDHFSVVLRLLPLVLICRNDLLDFID